ncbi:MAG: 16S rRNA (adenine(1518)-N(6)/adenine(1519)-N(6))-dimethyltransferase RsmA [Clostridia bacterium]|nr:16S rRNA (adenine(1518)-N(6)/adenine(1519)-N(6))-dimethyltransferase RsmA [Clostridia bacterium]
MNERCFMNLREETKAVLNKYGLRANKKLGQNFLINEKIIEDIVEKAEISKDDVVIEIGPGIGSLTSCLIANAKKVIAIEIDSNMVDILKARFGIFDNFEVIYGDVLRTNILELIKDYESVKVVANLPYYITTPIIMKLLEDRLNLKSITVMVQKEVGERICATNKDKEYGAITVSVQYYTSPKIIIDVPKENFLPAPEVDSCVIKLDILEKPRVEVKDEKLFFRLVKGAFTQRRKTINNSLTSSGKSKEEISDILTSLNIDTKLRAENLSIEQYAQIANML